MVDGDEIYDALKKGKIPKKWKDLPGTPDPIDIPWPEVTSIDYDKIREAIKKSLEEVLPEPRPWQSQPQPWNPRPWDQGTGGGQIYGTNYMPHQQFGGGRQQIQRLGAMQRQIIGGALEAQNQYSTWGAQR